jgi:Fe-S cluster biogenesis protein NfuA
MQKPGKKPVEKEPEIDSAIETLDRIRDVLSHEINLQLAEHGGGVELASYCPHSRTVGVTLVGECVDCPKKGLTIEQFIQETLREFIAEDLIVKEV